MLHLTGERMRGWCVLLLLRPVVVEQQLTNSLRLQPVQVERCSPMAGHCRRRCCCCCFCYCPCRTVLRVHLFQYIEVALFFADAERVLLLLLWLLLLLLFLMVMAEMKEMLSQVICAAFLFRSIRSKEKPCSPVAVLQLHRQ